MNGMAVEALGAFSHEERKAMYINSFGKVESLSNRSLTHEVSFDGKDWLTVFGLII